MKTIDITGQAFGTLRAVRPMFHRNNRWHWLVKCECGNVRTVNVGHLRTGSTTTCGDREAHPRNTRRTEAPTYMTVHDRVRKHLGSASAHSCVTCGNGASVWAYSGQCDQEAVSVNGTPSCTCEGHDHYLPTCQSCNVITDVLRRRGEVKDKTWEALRAREIANFKVMA